MMSIGTSDDDGRASFARLVRKEADDVLSFFDSRHCCMPALFQRRGGRVVSVPVNHRPRLRGASRCGMFDRPRTGIADALGLMGHIGRMKHAEVAHRRQ